MCKIDNRMVFPRLFLRDIENCNLETPQRFSSEKEYFETVRNSLVKYMDACNKHKSILDVDCIKKCCNNIIDSIKLYLEGEISSAQEAINTALQSLVEYDKIISTDIENCVGFVSIDTVLNSKKLEKHNLYRGRKAVSDEIKGVKDMLHVPFSKRSLVSSERFNIPGLPCLYLGSTSYVCWLELDKPQDNNFYVSALEFKENLKLLSITAEKDSICIWLNNHFKHTKEHLKVLNSLLCMLPFSYASSFSYNSSDNRRFKIEYIIPQMIMNYAKKNGYDGVAYLSNKMKRHSYDAYGTGVCFAIWANWGEGSSDYSDMCNNIKISFPSNFAEFNHLDIDLSGKKDTRSYSFIDYAGERCSYLSTDFYRFDRYLESLRKNDVDVDNLDK